MLSKNFSLLFFLRKAGSVEGGKYPVYMRITVNGSRTELSIQRECDAERWNSRSGRANGTKQEVKNLNAYLDLLQSKVHEIHRGLIDQEEPISAIRIKNLLLGIPEHSRMILEVFQHHNDQVEQLVGVEFSSGTLDRYKTSLEHTRNFLKWKYNVPDLEIRKLNYEFISEYAFWLKSIRKCGHNTTMKYLANFKKVVLICVKNGWLQKDPFVGFKLAKREIERPFLTEQELQTIATSGYSAP